MNSEPHENAAWRTFGMLDADEAASFDEAMRHDPALRSAYREMDSLTAAVAAVSVKPIAPRAGQMERLQLRLGLQARKRSNWPAISGWAAAAVFLMILVIQKSPSLTSKFATTPSTSPRVPTPNAPAPTTIEIAENIASTPHSTKADTEKSTTAAEPPTIIINQSETRRLIQEIEVLRGELANFQDRDRKRFETISGMAWPVVMRMAPPGEILEKSNPASLETDEPPLTAMLGDALTSTEDVPLLLEPANFKSADPTSTSKPVAIPIYDAARDTGTLVVSNLPVLNPTEAYNLWVTTDGKDTPTYVGRLPDPSVEGADSFDFSMGTKGMVPSAFILTKDPQGKAVSPSTSNTILEGPR